MLVYVCLLEIHAVVLNTARLMFVISIFKEGNRKMLSIVIVE